MLCFVYFGSDYVYMYVYVCICMCIYVCMYVYVCVCVYMCVCMYMYVYICVYVCICMCCIFLSLLGFLIFVYPHCYNIPNLTNFSKNVNRYQTSFSYIYTSLIVVLCINHTHITCNKFSTPRHLSNYHVF